MTFEFKVLSVRSRQAYAALCLRRFCQIKQIYHPAINELCNHLCLLVISDNLPEWERQGSLLDIPGRGDPLPDSVVAVIPPEDYDDFYRLMDYAVEVGIVDMYGAPTNQPTKCLLECILVLENNNIELPSFPDGIQQELAVENKCESEWGAPWSESKYELLMKTSRSL